MKKILYFLTLVVWINCIGDKSKKATHSLNSVVVATTKNRSLLRTFIMNPESILTFKNNLPKNFAFTCCPIPKFKDVDPEKYICYKFSFNRFDQKKYNIDEKPYGPTILEIFTIRDIRSKSANDYFDKNEILTGFVMSDTISGVKYSNLVGTDTAYIKTMFGHFDFKNDSIIGYETSEKKLMLHLNGSKIIRMEYKSNQ